MKNQIKTVLITITILSLAMQAVALPGLDIIAGTATKDQTLTVTIRSGGNATGNVLVQFILNGGTPIYAYTDSSGKAVFKPTDAGSLRIIATKDGYINGDVTVTVNSPSGGGVPSSSGGTSTGGGIGPSGENASNIDFRESYDLEIFKDTLTSYRFTLERNPVRFVNITGIINAGLVTTTVEGLKGTSSLVKKTPQGVVFKNLNIWVGRNGFAIPANIKDAKIVFKVDTSWLTDNKISGSQLKLLKWDGSNWVQLETIETGKDATSTFFESSTTSFSPFAISGITAITPTPPAPEVTGTVKPGVTGTAAQPGPTPTSLNWILYVVIVIIIIAAAYFFVIKKK